MRNDQVQIQCQVCLPPETTPFKLTSLPGVLGPSQLLRGLLLSETLHDVAPQHLEKAIWNLKDLSSTSMSTTS